MSLLNAISSNPGCTDFISLSATQLKLNFNIRDIDCAPQHTSFLCRSLIKRHPRAGRGDVKCLFLSEYRWRRAQDPIYLDAS